MWFTLVFLNSLEPTDAYIQGWGEYQIDEYKYKYEYL